MQDRAGKRDERRSTHLIGGQRHPASEGGPVDYESSWAVARYKEVRRLSLAELEALALEAGRQGSQRRKVGFVVVRRQAGGKQGAAMLVCMTAAVFREITGSLLRERAEGGERSLSVRERKLIKGMIEGKSIAQAAREAGYSSSSARSYIYRKLGRMF